MKKFFLLLKQEIFSTMSSSTINTKRKKNTPIENRVILIYILFTVLSIVYQVMYTSLFKAANIIQEYPKFIIGISVIFSVYSSFFYIKNALFGAKNYELLESLPISGKMIVSVKLTAIFLEELIYNLIFVLPGLILSIINGFPLGSGIYYIVMCIFLPIIPILVGGIISFIFTYLFERLRMGKVLQMLFTFVLVAAVIGISFLSGQAGGNGDAAYAQTLAGVGNGIFTGIPYLQLLDLTKFNGMGWIIYLAINLVCAAIFIFIVGWKYKQINNLILSTKVHVKYVKKDYHHNSKKKSLVTNEIKRNFKSVPFVTNIVIGYVLYLICIGVGIYLYYSMGNKDIESITSIQPLLPTILVCVMTFCFGMGVPTAVTITLEANNIWILKTAPIEYQDILKAKRMTAYVLGIIPLLIGLIASCVAFKLTIAQILTVVVISILQFVNLIFWGQWFNLRHPKLDWINEQQAIKQSTAVLIMVFLTMGFTLLMGGIVALGTIYLGDWLTFVIGSVAQVLLIVYPYLMLKKKGSRMFKLL